MTYTRSSPIRGASTVTGDQLFAAFQPMVPAGQLANVKRACNAIAIYSAATGLDPLVVAAIIWIETGAPGTGLPFRSAWYMAGFNFGNLGITGDDDQNAAAQTWTTPGDGVLATVAHLVGYSAGKSWRSVWDADALGDPTAIDKRFTLAIANTPNSAGVATLGDLNRRWAIDRDDDYGGKLAERANALAAAINDLPVTTPSTPAEPAEGEPMTPATLDYSSLSFPVEVRFIPAGQTMQRPGTPMQPTRTTWHDTGNPGARTNAESHAGWMAAGCPDGNGNPTYTSWHFTVDDGKAIQHIPLNEVAWHAGDGANGPGNLTSIAIEECVNSDRDAAKTRANAAELHAFLIKTLNLQSGTVNGCVQHNYWSGKNCPEVIRNAGLWPEMQRQMTARLGSIPTTPVYADAAPVAKGSAVINGYVFLAPGGKTVQADVVPVKYADKDQPATGPALKKGTKLTQDQIGHYVVGTDGALWVELVDVPGVKSGSRIPAIALISEAA